MVKVGTLWTGTDKDFIVISVIEQEGHTWIHYREHNPRIASLECKEYSCYEESFIVRFRQLPE